jgi:hypothetical protein
MSLATPPSGSRRKNWKKKEEQKTTPPSGSRRKNWKKKQEQKTPRVRFEKTRRAKDG